MDIVVFSLGINHIPYAGPLLGNLVLNNYRSVKVFVPENVYIVSVAVHTNIFTYILISSRDRSIPGCYLPGVHLSNNVSYLPSTLVLPFCWIFPHLIVSSHMFQTLLLFCNENEL